MSGPVLAFDIGGTKLAAAVVTADGTVHALHVQPTHLEQGWPAIVDRLFDMGQHSIAESGGGAVTAVGIACGGPLDPATGVLVAPVHLTGWQDVPIGRLAAETFGVPFALQNDASAAALAEYRFGAGRGTDTMLYLTISTGIGGGAVLDGKLYAGGSGNGTEFGHLTVVRGGRQCRCGRRGCIEAYASGTSIAERAREAVAGGRASVLHGEITAADVAHEAAAGDTLAREVWDETVDLLGAAVTDLVNVFEPDLVVLGGGVTRAGPMLIDPIGAIVAREAMPPAADRAQVCRAELGDLVGVVGAAAIAQQVGGAR